MKAITGSQLDDVFQRWSCLAWCCRYKVIVHHQGQSAITEYRRLKVLRRLPRGHGQPDQDEGMRGPDPVICSEGQKDEELYSLLEVRQCATTSRLDFGVIMLIGQDEPWHSYAGHVVFRCTRIGEPDKWADTPDPCSYAIDWPPTRWGSEVGLYRSLSKHQSTAFTGNTPIFESYSYRMITCCTYGRYNPARRSQRQSEWCDRLFLHAQRLQFEALPAGGSGGSEVGGTGDETVDVSVALPAELQAVLKGMSEVEGTVA
jgi:hypothetical protein